MAEFSRLAYRCSNRSDAMPSPSISTPSMNNAVVAYGLLAHAMGLIRQASQMAPHLFTDGALEVVINDLDTEMLELQRLPDWK